MVLDTRTGKVAITERFIPYESAHSTAKGCENFLLADFFKNKEVYHDPDPTRRRAHLREMISTYNNLPLAVTRWDLGP